MVDSGGRRRGPCVVVAARASHLLDLLRELRRGAPRCASRPRDTNFRGSDLEVHDLVNSSLTPAGATWAFGDRGSQGPPIEDLARRSSAVGGFAECR